ncbi:MAG: hypothetical protein WED05_02635 [Candidatus Atabeyarchaeum deiterrae]
MSKVKKLKRLDIPQVSDACVPNPRTLREFMKLKKDFIKANKIIKGVRGHIRPRKYIIWKQSIFDEGCKNDPKYAEKYKTWRYWLTEEGDERKDLKGVPRDEVRTFNLWRMMKEGKHSDPSLDRVDKPYSEFSNKALADQWARANGGYCNVEAHKGGKPFYLCYVKSKGEKEKEPCKLSGSELKKLISEDRASQSAQLEKVDAQAEEEPSKRTPIFKKSLDRFGTCVKVGVKDWHYKYVKADEGQKGILLFSAYREVYIPPKGGKNRDVAIRALPKQVVKRLRLDHNIDLG